MIGRSPAPAFVLRAHRIFPRPGLGAASWVPALAVVDGRVAAAGSEAEVLAAAGARARRIDLGPATVLPAFTDAHIHLGKYALSLRQLLVPNDASLDACLEQVARRAAEEPEGRWILGRGWDHSDWGRWPRAADLDRVAPNHPVALWRKDGHALWLSGRALELAGIEEAGQAPEGGEILVEDGRPSGILKENAMRLARAVIPEPTAEERRSALEAAWPSLWREGIVACHDMGYRGMALWEDLQTLRRAGRLGQRVVWYALADAFEEALSQGLHRARGDDWLRFGGLKLFLDGTLGSQTADMLEPYEGQAANRGLPTLDYEQFCDGVQRAAEAGLPTAVHAIGDGANRKALDGFQSVGQRLGPRALGLRQRIEHAQLLHPQDIPRFETQQVVASMQPIHLAADMRVAQRYWGDRCRQAYAWRSLLEAGAHLAFGSDAPIEPISVVDGLRCALRRQDGSGAPEGGWHPEQRLDLWQALAAYTEGASWAAGLEARLGRLEPGYPADLVVLEGDPADWEARPDAMRLRATMLEGRWLWQSD